MYKDIDVERRNSIYTLLMMNNTMYRKADEHMQFLFKRFSIENQYKEPSIIFCADLLCSHA